METVSHPSSSADAMTPTPVIIPEPAQVAGVNTPVINLNDRSDQTPWRFLFAPVAGIPNPDAPCQDIPAGTLPTDGWQPVAVPSELAMQGFDIENNIEYLYRRMVEVPADFAGQRVLVRFDGVYSEARVWANGRFVRAHSGGFTTWDCDVTEVVTPGVPFELVVGVADLEGDTPGPYNRDGHLLGNPSWASYYAHHNIGGILRDVTLIAVPQVHVVALHVETSFAEDRAHAALAVSARVEGGTAGDALDLVLTDAEGAVAGTCRAACTADGTVRTTINVADVHPWDAEHPYLYTLEAQVVHDGAATEALRKLIGFREIWYGGAHGTEPNRIYVNGREVKLRGTCRHDVSDRHGRSTTREEDWAEILAYRAANINHIRTSHYPPSRHLLEACDELGMYVEDENSACFQGTGGKWIYAEAKDFLTPFTEMIERDRDHPSVIIWSLGNESAFDRTPAFRQEFDYIKRVDPSRPVIFSYPYTVESLPLPYDIISRHYESVDGCLGDANLPVLHDEFAHIPCYNINELKRDPNVRTFWGEGLRRAWEHVFETAGSLGCDLWSGVDDVFPLPAGVDGRWQRHSRGTWTGYGEWGCIFDCHKREKPEAFLVRKAFSPVRVDEDRFYVVGSQLIVPIKNWFDHTNLTELELVVTVDGSVLSNVAAPSIAPHADGVLVVEGDWSRAREVVLTWQLAERVVDEQTLRLAPEPAAAHHAALPAPELAATASEFRITCANGAVYRFSRRTSLLIAAEFSGRSVLTGGPWLHLTGTELARPWTPTRTPWAAVEGDHVIVALQGGYGTRVPMQLICRIFGDGRMDVEFNTRETNLNTDSLSELGIAFDLADDVVRVSWERDAPYAAWPTDHIGRARGTAERICPEALEAGRGALPTWPWRDDMFNAYLSEPSDGSWRAATNDFKVMRERIRSYSVQFKTGDAQVTALSDGRAAARVELSGAHPQLIINQQWWYPQLGWGNDCGRPVQLVEGTGRGEASIRVEAAGAVQA